MTGPPSSMTELQLQVADPPTSMGVSSPSEESHFHDPLGLGGRLEYTVGETDDSPWPTSMRDLMNRYRLAIRSGLPPPTSQAQSDFNRILRVMVLLPTSDHQKIRKAWMDLLPMMTHQALLSLIPLLSLHSSSDSGVTTGSLHGTTTRQTLERYSSGLPQHMELMSPSVKRLLPKLAPVICKAISDFLMLFDSEQCERLQEPPAEL